MLKKILLTFDYEVFFYKMGTVEKCIIEPTDYFLNFCRQRNISATFFVDATFLAFLIKNSDQKLYFRMYKLIEQQISKILKSNHRIELHIHPHWYFAELKDGILYYPKEKFRIQNCNLEEIDYIIGESYNILLDICKNIFSGYEITCYRAGGWCIQPFDKIKNILLKYNIIIDSSVAFGLYDNTDTHFYNFKNSTRKSIYRFDQKPEIEDTSGKFIEIPISTYKTNPYRKLQRKYLLKEKFNSWGDGVGINVNKNNLIRKLFNGYSMFSIDGNFDIQYNLDRVLQYDLNTVNFISHPKNFTKMSFKFLDLLNLYDVSYYNIYEYCMEYKVKL